MSRLRPLLLLSLGAVALGAVAPAAPARAQGAPLDSATVAAFPWRQIGPAVMGGRVTDVEGVPGDPRTFYVATAAGGLWKTVNAGTTFTPLFDHQKVVSLGDLAIAPSDPNVLYLGTGEEDARNSISPGAGVYKSTDAGKTWTLVGLEDTQSIGRIVVDPRDANVAYVAAVGHTWGPNRQRGLYKTTDGGKTWTLSKFVSDRAGFIDVAMDPSDPNTLYASSWERLRGPYFLTSGGPGSALWKTTDAGRTWTEVKGGGFPATMKGRIGLAIAASNPKVVYATVEADTNANQRSAARETNVDRPGDRGAANPRPRTSAPDTTKRQKTNSGLYRSTDGGATWTLMARNEGDARPFYYSQVRADPKNPDRVYWMSSVFRFSDDGGKTVRRGALSIHTDWHAMWIDPNDPAHYVIGQDGGIAVTWDKGGTYDFVNNIPIGQFYAVSYDMAKPYHVCGGLQDNGSWCGPSRSPSRFGIMNEMWINVGGGDGFYTAQDPTDPNVVYSESQGGNASRLDLASGARVELVRGLRDRSYMFEDSLVVARGDTTKPPTTEVEQRLAAIRARVVADSAKAFRFNWQTPYFLSPHAPSTLYFAGNRLLKSVDRGDHFVPISPDLSTRDSLRINVSRKTTGGITKDATGAETHGTITTVAESPVRPGLLWAGTDDGNVWLTRNDGATWENLTGRFPGLPPKTWVSRVEASHFDTATVYVTFDRHRDDDFRPFVYASTDFGRTFRPIVRGLPTDSPQSFVHVIREDPRNRDLLFLGTDAGAYVSADRGATWQRFMTNLPTVPVHDLKIHPRDHEIIAATHGRSLWIADVAALEDLAGARGDSLRGKAAHLFAAGPAYEYQELRQQAWNGNRAYAAPNPPYGTAIAYRLTGSGAATTTAGGTGSSGAGRADSARVVVTGVAGDTVRVLRGPANAGINRVYWDLRRSPKPLGPKALQDSIIAARKKQRQDDSTKAAAGAARDTAAARDTSAAVAGRGRAVPGDTTARAMRPAEAPLGAPADYGSIYQRRRVGNYVPPGDYLVTVTAGGQTVRGVVHVERVGDVAEETDDGGDEE